MVVLLVKSDLSVGLSSVGMNRKIYSLDLVGGCKTFRKYVCPMHSEVSLAASHDRGKMWWFMIGMAGAGFEDGSLSINCHDIPCDSWSICPIIYPC